MKNLGSGWYLSTHNLFSGILQWVWSHEGGVTPGPQTYLQVRMAGMRATKGDRQ